MKKLVLTAALALLSACAHSPDVVIKETPVEVLVPVAAPCMGKTPVEVVPLKKLMSKGEWSIQSTIERESRIGNAALDRKIYGDQLTAAAAGCP